MEHISDVAFSGHPDLHQWRVIRHGAECRFRTDDAAPLTAFVTQVLAVAERTGATIDLDVRSGVVSVRLGSTDQLSLTDACVEAALDITRIADAHGVAADPSTTARTEIAIDALDIDRVLPFWRAVLGYVDEPTPAGRQVTAIVDPERINAAIWFQQMDAPRPQRNRIHLDVNVAHDRAVGRIEAAVAAGGTVLSDARARAFWVLADPEGNEVCVCTWQDRG